MALLVKSKQNQSWWFSILVLIGLPEEQVEPDAWALSLGGLLLNKFRVQAGRRVLRLPVGFSFVAKAEIHSLALFFFW